MAVQIKDPAKPGYMSTEFWAMIAVGLKTFGGKVGLSPEQVDETVSSFSGLLDGLGDNPITLIVFGVVVIVYTLVRGYLKKTEIIANARIAIEHDKLQGGKDEISKRV